MPRKGQKHSEETKRKIGDAHKGMKRSEEAKAKMSEAQKGKKMPPRTEEHRKKLSESKIGKKRAPFSEEWRQKMSEANKGRKLPPRTEEYRRKMSESQKGKKLSEETRQKMSESQKGRKHSEETKAKMREAIFAYAAKMGGFMIPTIGRNEKQILDNLEQELGVEILRQFKVGGYFIDGYIPEMDLAIEVDEKHHQCQSEKDKQREEFIKSKLGCQFLRIKDY